MYLLLCGGMGLGVQGGFENLDALHEASVIEPTTLVALRAAEAKALLRMEAENVAAHINKCFGQQHRRWREKWFGHPVDLPDPHVMKPKQIWYVSATGRVWSFG